MDSRRQYKHSEIDFCNSIRILTVHICHFRYNYDDGLNGMLSTRSKTALGRISEQILLRKWSAFRALCSQLLFKLKF